MTDEVFGLKQIFGLKIKEIRQDKGITYQQLREETGLSVSYLSEIENGKKYPKSDKIMLLSKALKVQYDDLVSLKVPKKLQPISDLVQSDFFRAFPLKEFGLDPQKLVEIVSQDPTKVNAFINTILQISRNYELKNEKFFNAALRSYREIQNNYFEDLEERASDLNLEFTELAEIPFNQKTLSTILLQLGVRTEFQQFSKEADLQDIRSIYQPHLRKLLINEGLHPGQINFIISREIAFQWLRLKKRSFSTPSMGEQDFESILNNYQASYFAAALMMPEKMLVEDFKKFANQEQWNPESLIELLRKYNVTPEMLFQRLSNVLPKHFDLKSLFFLRFVGKGGNFTLTKELHLTNTQNQHGNELNEFYCRRWASLKGITEVMKRGGKGVMAKAQIEKYLATGQEYLCLTFAFPNVSNPNEAISVTVGFLVNKKSRELLKFLSDPDIEFCEVNTTCERCGLTDCKERASKPTIYDKITKDKLRQTGISELISQH